MYEQHRGIEGMGYEHLTSCPNIYIWSCFHYSSTKIAGVIFFKNVSGNRWRFILGMTLVILPQHLAWAWTSLWAETINQHCWVYGRPLLLHCKTLVFTTWKIHRKAMVKVKHGEPKWLWHFFVCGFISLALLLFTLKCFSQVGCILILVNAHTQLNI